MEESDVSNLYVFPLTKVSCCWVSPSIAQTLLGGDVPGFTTLVTVKVFKLYWPITLVCGWTLNSPYIDPSSPASLL